ncbi:GntR family transcriptional regulator [Synoicihabitans lomoniglobus]|uniref:GntR family transcriptional regulator n=1 Tax=Synoicihabitans lomoniglobus TaxID=2909285 RepID=A0AAF0A183_9BACT|nr:GntR family transcriptional regulator [Opitutaceae bacterium LMO-M01]WED64807.1 GntR family transcriptional regulator [Opitutaceae bacterium LMO-M01]
MLPFTVEIKPGLPIAEQVIHAVKKAVLTGQLKAGDPFVSVRQLSTALRINPNTAHKIVGALKAEGVLITTPAVGTTVGTPPAGSRADKAAVLGPDLEHLVVEARRLGLKLTDVQKALLTHWERLGGDASA